MKIDPLKLRQVSVFQNATDEDLNSIARQGIERSIEEGEFFFFQGDPAAYLYVLVSGRAKLIQTNPAGQQVNLRTINEWQMFGALGSVREGAGGRDVSEIRLHVDERGAGMRKGLRERVGELRRLLHREGADSVPPHDGREVRAP